MTVCTFCLWSMELVFGVGNGMITTDQEKWVPGQKKSDHSRRRARAASSWKDQVVVRGHA